MDCSGAAGGCEQPDTAPEGRHSDAFADESYPAVSQKGEKTTPTHEVVVPFMYFCSTTLQSLN
jgi:hypothetical protein